MASPLPPDPYQALGVPKNAPIATIRSAHRKLVLQCHPDKVQDDSLRAQKQDEFHKIQQAYEILSDDQRRQRYDEQVKLAELRREVLERGGGRGAAHYEIPSGATGSSFFEVRAGRIYEERVPGRSFDDDHMSSRYEQQRASARKYDGYEASSRRSSGREQDERRRAKVLEDERERLRVTKERVRESERSGHSDRRRTREKDRKRDYDDKYSRRSYAEDATDSDSDDTEVYYGSKQGSDGRKRHEEVRSKERAIPETPRRSGSLRDEHDMDEWDHKFMSARDYIEKSRGAGGPVEVDARRPSAYRSATTSGPYVEARSTIPPPPPPIDTGRRSSGRTHERVRAHSRPRSSGKERKGSIEIVEPAGRSYETRKTPSMPTSASSPANIKIPVNPRSAPQPHRSSTMQYVRDSKHDAPSIRRSETSPLGGMTSRRNDTARGKSSNLKNLETHDSGYSSPGTPETQYPGASPQPRSTKYQIVDDEEDYTRGHRTVLVDPESTFRRQRSVSPHSRRTPERPTIATRGSSSARHVAAGRATSYAFPPESTPSSRQGPPLSRTESSRAPPPLSRAATSREPQSTSRGSFGRGPQLYGEIPKEEPYEVRWSPKIRAEDIRYSNHGRKGSESSGRDAYPRSQYPESHRHPGMGRQESYAY
ncbi:MAG: hypothetical protein M1830_004514 [Pleopsidium flavum]|nr:MAG: hypothetical protein M1830_009630 [Pleopsidium flavum]KAI9877209.1 MAG: hypothetical protein M1830_004514 [Pleopsidium flavum]